jgi:hypothetical protein
MLGCTAFGRSAPKPTALSATPDPMKAIENAAAQRRFDEIILSTLPPGVSRWLAMDLPHRVKRKVHVPLTVITGPEWHTRIKARAAQPQSR